MKKLTIYLMLLFVASFTFAQTSTWDGTATSWTQGSGTSSSPYLIESAQNLAYLAEMVNGGVSNYSGKYFKLTTNINLNNLAWTPIGDYNTTSAVFCGNFDGDNHSITKLKINSSTLKYGGFFGYINGGTIRNININGTITLTSNSSNTIYIGSIVGYTKGTVTFENCNSSITMSTNSNYITYSGGLIGYCYNSVTINNCSNSGNVTATSTSAICSGGLIGYCYNSVAISNSSNSGNVSATRNASNTGSYYGTGTLGAYSGGIVGQIRSEGTITLCSNTNAVSSSISTSFYCSSDIDQNLNVASYSGGIVGHASQLTISLCYNKGTVSSTSKSSANNQYPRINSYSGGILGYGESTIINSYNRGNVSATSKKTYDSSYYSWAYEYASGIGYNSKNTNCYNTGTLTAPTTNCNNTYKYGIGTGTTTNCYYLQTCGSTGGRGTSKTESAMKSQSFPAILNSDVFMMDLPQHNVNDGYPIFGTNLYVITESATNLNFTTATLNGWYYLGTSYPNPPDMQGFEYKKSSASSWTTVYVNVGTPASHNLTGLTNGTNYQYRMFVKVGDITIYGNTVEFTTTACNAAVSITSGTTQICDNSSVTLTASATSSGSISSYAWSNNSTTRAITVRSAGTYKVTVTDQYGCTATASCAMTSITAPTASISGNSYVCTGNSTTLTASGGVGYVWSTGATTPSISVSNAGTYSVIARASNNCTDTAYINITAFNEVSISGNTTICAGGSTTLTVSGGSSYRWSTGATTRSITVTNEGLYSVTATSGQCTANASVYVTVNALPNVSISGNTTICGSASTTLTASGGTSYTWSNNATSQSINISTAGTYKVTATNASGCTASVSANVVSAPNPTPQITGNLTACEGETVTLAANGGTSYSWSNGSTNASISVTSGGTYTVVASNNAGCTASTNATVTINERPAPVISGNLSICDGESTTLSVNGGDSFVWSNGSTSASINVSNSGNYSVVASNSNGCTASASAIVNVMQNPMVTIIGDPSICIGEATYLTAEGGVSYVWNNGFNNQSINVSDAGTYSVVATDANGCTSSASIVVTQNSLPEVSISDQQTICNGSSTTLLASGGTSYVWSNGSTDASISVTTGGTYSVVVGSNAGCTASASTTVFVNDSPVPVINGNLSICEGESTTLSVTGGDSFVWSNGSTETSIDVASSGNYSVIASNSNGCTASASATVNVMENPIVTISGEPSMCVGEATYLTAEGGVSYVWNNEFVGQGINVYDAGTYSVVATDANGCTSSASIVVTQNSLPEVSISDQQTICSGSSATLLASGGTSYEWSNGSTDASISVTTGGTYTVVVTNGAGCTATASAMVTVNESPLPQISGNLSICEGASTMLSVSGGDSYVWSNGSTSAGINVTSSGNYSVIASNSNGCTASASATVNVMENPTVTISGEPSICVGGATTLVAEGGVSYLWSTGFPGQSINVSEAGTYSVVATGANGCTTSASMVVVQYSAPEVSISGNTTVCEGSSETLTATGGVSYVWSTGETTSAISVNAFGIYSVIATGNGGCTSTANVTVFVASAPTPTINGDLHICDGEPTTLTANGGETYMWSNGSTSNSINVSNGGTYSVIATNENGCTAMVSANVVAGYSVTNAISETTDSEFVWNGQTYTESGDYVQTFTAANGCDSVVTLHLTVNSVQYYNIFVISNNNAYGTTTGTGVYEANAEIQISATANDGYEFLSWNDGNTDTLRTITVTGDATYIATFIPATGIEENANLQISIFPNPATDILNITSSETISEIEIVNALGQVVYRTEVNADNAVCDVEGLKAGVYVVRIHGTDTVSICQRKFIKE
ncbi:MAG: T9SS type A sorting domain-containing protein [Bacteroidales bacterium]|nr:T9SS type A sorting domain-containing protein [Bacteroidales bacterium]